MSGRKYRIFIPRPADELSKLADDILAKHEADQGNSPIPQAIADAMNEANAKAKTEKAKQVEQKNESVRLTRDLNLELGITQNDSSYTGGTVMYYVKSARDVLAGNYRINLRKLNEWGFEVVASNGELKVIIPQNDGELLRLTGKILAKHESDRDASPLKNLDMVQFKALYDTAKPKLDQIDKLRKGSEIATEAGNNLLGIGRDQTTKTAGTVLYFVCSIRDILAGIYRGNERKLGEWGFTVNAAVAMPSEEAAQPQALEAATSPANGLG